MNRRDFVARLALALTLPSSMYICSASAQVLQRQGPLSAGLQLTESQVSLLANVCEAILPTTDTPGARAANVQGFIATLFVDWMSTDEQEQFYRGLAQLEQRLAAAASAPVLAITDRQMALLVAREAQVLSAPDDSDYKAFFKMLRSLTIVGYYTSEIGQQQELKVQFGAGQNSEVGPAMASTYSV